MEQKEHLEPNKNKKSIVIGEQIGPNIANLGLGVFSFLNEPEESVVEISEPASTQTNSTLETQTPLSEFTSNNDNAIPLPDFTDSPSTQTDISVLENVDRTLSGFVRPEKVDLSLLSQKEIPPVFSEESEVFPPISLAPLAPIEEESNSFEIPFPEFTEAPSTEADPQLLSQLDQTLHQFVRPEKVDIYELRQKKSTPTLLKPETPVAPSSVDNLQKKWPRQVEEEVGTPFTLPEARKKIFPEKETLSPDKETLLDPLPVETQKPSDIVVERSPSSYDISSLKVRQKTERIEKKEDVFLTTSSDEGEILSEVMLEKEAVLVHPADEMKPLEGEILPKQQKKDRSVLFTFVLALFLFAGVVGYDQFTKWNEQQKKMFGTIVKNETKTPSFLKELISVRHFIQENRFEQAESLLKKLLSESPQEMEAVLAYSHLLVIQKRFEEATPFLRQLSVSTLAPSSLIQYHLLQTEVDLAQENLASAWNGISQVLRLEPQSTQALKFRAKYYYLKKAYSYVIQDATEVLKSSSQMDLELLQLRGFSYYWRNLYAEALSDLKLLQEPAIFLKRARCYTALGELEKASNDYLEYLKAFPEDQEARQENIQLLEKLGETEKIVSEFQKLGKAIPAPILYKQSVQLYQEEKWDETLNILAQVLKQQPDYWQAQDLRAKIFYKQERWKECLTALSFVLQHQPSSAAHKLRGVVNFKLKHFTEAASDFSASLSLEATDPQIYYYRGMCFEVLPGQQMRAIEDYTSALKLRSDFIEALQRRAYLWERIENHRAALQDYSTLIQLHPQGSFYFARGNLYRLLREETKALSDYHQAIALSPENLRYYNQRAIFYFSRSQYEEAIQDWEYILSQDPQQTSDLMKIIQKAKEKHREELK